MRTRFLTGVTAGFFLAVSTSFAAPPLGCWEKKTGERWCESFGVPYRRDPVRPDPTPQPLPDHQGGIYQPVGQVVKTIPLAAFLPGYFEPRNVEFSPYIKQQALQPAKKP